jgi:Brp/Blh family beta-carotene 15,15'-monooxygenase
VSAAAPLPAAVPGSWQRGHRRAALAASLALAGPLLLWPPGPGVQAIVLALAVGLLGLPHGAVDHWQGRALLRPPWGRAWPAVFALGYLGAVATVLAAWLVWPPVLLTGFLVLAAVHFGDEDLALGGALPAGAPGRGAELVARGALPIAGPVLGHPGESAALFALLLPELAAADVAPVLARAAPVAAALLAGALALAAVAAVRRRLSLAAELVLLAGLMTALPPLLAFALYFCLWHAPRHSLSVIAGLSPHDPVAGARRFVRGAAALTGVTLVGASAGWLLLDGAAAPVAATLQVTFVGLAALTLPHVVLGALTRRRRRAGPGTRNA